MSNLDTLTYSAVTVGDKLPALEMPITTSLIVGGSIVTRDFTPVHHDKAAAQAGGLPDVFMNILTSTALMGRFVTDWAGPDCTLKASKIKLGAPNLPGFVMTITGEVTAKDEEEKTAEISVQGVNDSWGMHMLGTVTVALPANS